MIARIKDVLRPYVHKSWRGVCPICEHKVHFIATGPWYRDQLFCNSCWSIPRERALMKILAQLYPNWRDLTIHESSPGPGGVSRKLRTECKDYVVSQYIPEMEFGARHSDGYLNQNLEDQTFADESFDIVVTQDVFEHIFHPDKAIQEIVRTLKPGGAHIMTVPIVNKDRPTRRRAELKDGQIVHLLEEQYHGNPVGDGRSLVTVDWGYDIAEFLADQSGYSTIVHVQDDLASGIRAEYIEVLVTRKPAVPTPELI